MTPEQKAEALEDLKKYISWHESEAARFSRDHVQFYPAWFHREAAAILRALAEGPDAHEAGRRAGLREAVDAVRRWDGDWEQDDIAEAILALIGEDR
jgi:hypothetical protein